MRKLILTVATLALSLTSMAQKGQEGDHVEIFGRERAERVDEGEVAYKFDKGYFVKNTGNGGNYFYRHNDVIAWELFNGTFSAPSEDNLRAHNYGRTREAIQWTPITANEKSTFADPGMRGAYLYSEYDAPKSETLLLLATANTRSFINGMPHEGDHYDFATTLIPFVAKKGINQFIFTAGRYGHVAASIIRPDKPVMFSDRDMTKCDIIIGEDNEKWSAVRVINASNKKLSGLTITCELESGEKATYKTDDVMDMMTQKLQFLVPATANTKEGNIKATLTLKDSRGRTLDVTETEFRNVDPMKVHERTFISGVDGSVQYYSVQPSSTKGDGQALFLSVHGAGVEARNQARAYSSKDWGHVICATNRRPFGFNWEDIGRLDAIEVLEDARKVYKTAPEKTYLTGHSMGGHGTWYLGATFPDKFAAIAPCASYPDIVDYVASRSGGISLPGEQFPMIERAAQAGRVKELKRNYLQSGIYILHGDADKVVPIDMVREMRQDLATFHPDVSWYEEPGGSHWYGNESVDWKPIFDYYKWHTIPATNSVKHIEFVTASPGVSAQNYWATISQQQQSFNYSKILLDIEADSVVGTTENVAVLKLDFDNMPISGDVTVALDGSAVEVDGKGVVTLRKSGDKWSVSELNDFEKSEIRAGGFKEVFANNVVFVYPTKGSSTENAWYKNKARFDAETMLYRGNGAIDIVSDREFLKGGFDNRNVILFGNATNNAAWRSLLSESPLQITSKSLTFGDETITGDDLGAYFVYPRPNTSGNLVGVIAGTGLKGAYATYPNDYLQANTGFPDVMVFRFDGLKDGISQLGLTGFFGGDWSIQSGEFVNEL